MKDHMCTFYFLSEFAASLPTGWVGGQVKWAVINGQWERGEIAMCIAVPDTSILAEIGQLIKYSSSNNSQTEALQQNLDTLVSWSCSINWLAIFGGHGLLNKKMKNLNILQGLLHPRALDGVL